MTTMRRTPSLLQLGPGQHRRWWMRIHHRLRHLLPLVSPSSSSYYSSPPSPSPSKPPRLLLLLAAACASLGLFLLLAASVWSSVAWIVPAGKPASGGGKGSSSILFPQQQQQHRSQRGDGVGTGDANGGHGTTDGSGRYTVVINTWKRYDLLRRSVGHYASCPGVDTIRVVWSEPDPPSQDLRDSLARLRRGSGIPPAPAPPQPKVRFDLNTENSLNNRFKEMDGLATDAVFSVDDDVILPCRAVEFAFQVWRTAPGAMVGFVPRVHWPQEQMPGGTVGYRYGGWLEVWWKGTYSMVLSKVAFFHRRYLSIYTNDMYASIRDYVTANRNCEDIAMSFLVANLTKAPPIWVQGSVSEIGSFGISSLGGHSQRRTQCLNDFAAIYGHMPLIPTTVKAVDSRQAWFW